MNLKITNIQISSYVENKQLPNLQYLSDRLCEDNDIEYVLTKSKAHSSLDKIDVTNLSSIFTKLKDYPYEFEINSSLLLASIDGVKIAEENKENCDHISASISNFDVEIKEINGTYVTLQIPESTQSQAKAYIYLINGNVVGASTESNYTYTNLQLSTPYNLTVIAVDSLGKLRKSNPKDVSTLDKEYLFNNGLEYNYLTGGYSECSDLIYNGVTTGTTQISNQNGLYSLQFTSNNNSNGYAGSAAIKTNKFINKRTFSNLVVEYNYSTTDNYTREIITLNNFNDENLYMYSLPGKSNKVNEKQIINLSTITSNFYVKLTASAVLRC